MRGRFVEWYVKILFDVWLLINLNIRFVIDIFIYQQEGTIFYTRKAGFLLEYMNL